MRSKTGLILSSILAAAAAAFPARAGLVKTFGGSGRDAAESIALDSATNMYAGGRFEGTVDFNPDGPAHTNVMAKGGGADAFLCKFSPDGTFQWVRAWGAAGLDRVTAVAVDASNNVYAAGEFQNTVDFNPQGPVRAILQSASADMNDAFLCKYDAAGSFQWARAWGGSRGDEAYSLAVDAAGNAYVVGDSCSPTLDFNPAGGHSWYTNHEGVTNLFFDAWLCKYDADGNFLWARAWGGNGYDDCCAVSVDGLGNLFVGGMFGSMNDTCDFNSNTNAPHAPAVLNAHGPALSVVDSFLCKYDTDGNFQWARSWGSTNDDPGQCVVADGLGNVYMTGYFGKWYAHDGEPRDTVDFNPAGAPSNITSRGGSDVYLCKYSPSGTLLWAETWGGARDDAPGQIGMDPWGYLYVPGYFQDTADFDPGAAASNLTASANRDMFLSKLDADGRFVMARACGGPGDDIMGDVAVDGAGQACGSGGFAGTVDFGPLCGGPSANSGGDSDAFVMRVPTCCRLTVRKTGSGDSSLGASSPALRTVPLGITTQIVFTAADWHRIQALARDGTAIDAAAGLKVYTQGLVNVTADLTNDVTFALATPAQTGYTNVPTAWLAQWAEAAIVADPAYDVHSKYLLGLDPTGSNTFQLRIESFGVSDAGAVTVLKRTCTGGLSPDGMHGQLQLQAADALEETFTNMPGTARTGAAAFDAGGRATYTHAAGTTPRFIRAAIQ